MVIRRGLAQAVTLLVAILVLAGVSATPAVASSSSEFAAKINAARAAKGANSLVVKADLNAVAQAQAERMADKSDLFHNPNLGGSVSNWSMLAENVGYGPDVATIHRAFMNSSGHRANILNAKYTQVGVGVVIRDNVMWVAEVFRRPSGTSAGSGGSTTAKPPAAKKPAAAAKKPSSTKAPAVKKPTAAQPPAAKPKIVVVAVPRSVPMAARRAEAASSARDRIGLTLVSAKSPAVPVDSGGDFPLSAAATVGLLALLILGNTARLRLR